MEIRFPACGDTPYYLGEIGFSREGGKIIIQVIHPEKNYAKAHYEIDAVRFNQMADMLLSEPG